jgi:hypothetical protein
VKVPLSFLFLIKIAKGMKRIIVLDSEDDFIEVDDINIVRDLLVCVHPTRNRVGALTKSEPTDSKYIWKISNGNGLLGYHNSLKEAINAARTNGYEVRLLTSKDFDV